MEGHRGGDKWLGRGCLFVCLLELYKVASLIRNGTWIQILNLWEFSATVKSEVNCWLSHLSCFDHSLCRKGVEGLRTFLCDFLLMALCRALDPSLESACVLFNPDLGQRMLLAFRCESLLNTKYVGIVFSVVWSQNNRHNEKRRRKNIN